MGSSDSIVTVTKRKSRSGKSKKDRQHSKNSSSGKYKKQSYRTNARKLKRWGSHLEKHPHDLKNKHDIKAAREKRGL